MKNKRWKREAKRLKGECLSNELCATCKSFDKCFGRYLKLGAKVPELANIRDLEIVCKGAK